MDKTQKTGSWTCHFCLSTVLFKEKKLHIGDFLTTSVISRGTIRSWLNSKGWMDAMGTSHRAYLESSYKGLRGNGAALLWRSSDNKREIALLLLHPLWQNIEKIKLIWKGVKIYSKRRERDQRGRCKNVIISPHNHSSRMMAYLCNCWETLPMFHYPSELLTAQGLCIDTAFKSFILMRLWKL